MFKVRFFYTILSFFSLIGSQPLVGVNIFDPTKLFTPEKDEREVQLKHLKEDYQKIKEQTLGKLKTLQENITHVDRTINEVKNQLKDAASTDQEFLQKKLSLLNETYQTKLDIQFTLKEIPVTVEQQIKILEEYIKDPEFKGLVLEPRSFYPYEVVQSAIKKVLDQEERINNLVRQKNDLAAELENKKKKLAAAVKDYQEKKKEQEEFSLKEPETKTESELTFKQRGELVDLEEKLDGYEQQLAELQEQATARKVALINTTIFIEQEKQKILKNNLARTKSGLRIAETEVQEAKEKLDKRKQQALTIKDARYEEIKKLSAAREKLKKELEVLSKRLNAPILEKEELSAWSVEQPSVEAYIALCELGFKNTQIQAIERKIDYLHEEIQLENAKLQSHEIKYVILMTWYDLAHHKYKDNDEILGELKKFKERESEINREINSFQDKRNAAINKLNFQNKELTNLRNFALEIQKEKDTIFKRYPMRYQTCWARLGDAEKMIGEQIDVNGKLIEIYSNIITVLQGTNKEINNITAELETKSIWQRSQYAISWQGLKNIGPDLVYFVADLFQIGKSFLVNLSWRNLAGAFSQLLRSPAKILLWIIVFIIIISFFLLLRRRLPEFAEYLLEFRPTNPLGLMALKTIGCFVFFLQRNLAWLYGWVVLFYMIHVDVITELFTQILFYVCSIPFLIYFARKFTYFFVSCNRKNKFSIFSETFERRFIVVFSIFAYLTIFVLFFREAFMLATVHKSELPRILLAGYSIFLRTLLIFSIGKEEILALISKRGAIGAWLAYIIDDYYYPLMIGIIVFMIMSDPYVGGYGSLVSYIVWGSIGTIILARLLYLGHTYLKKYSEQIFFSTDEEVKRERFGYAKTWYGVFAIFLFVVFVLLGVTLITKIWGIPLFFEDMLKVLDYGIFSTGIEKGQPIWFTPRKLLFVLGFIVTGFLVSAAFNRFVLHRIFDILPVDVGIQNTVQSIIRYLVIVIAVYIGFQWANLGNLLIALGIVFGSIGYIVKEPLGDFISYFIILVQRPIQIGDFIMLDENTQGVVRKITPRSVILRRKNSYTIILPNSTILTHPVSNWSYGRNFMAFDDIYMTINYSADPFQVRKIILEVLDQNTDVLKSPAPVIRLHEFGEYGFVFLIRAFVSNINVLRRWDIASDVRFALVAELRKNNIKIAIPARLVYQDEKTHQKPPIDG
jgi:small-conductance mechanosensitive channel